MNSDELKKLRQFYHSLLGQQRILEGISSVFVRGDSILPLEHELQQLNGEFPSLMPAFNKNYYYSRASDSPRSYILGSPVRQDSTQGGEVTYDLTAIRSYIAILIGKLQVVIEQPSDIPVTEKRQFAFIKDSDLRTIIERDYSEIQRAYISNCWKSVIILCGGAIEAILTDLLTSNETAAKSAKSAPKRPDFTRWDLSELISVAVELNLVSTGVEKLSHSLREYRNLVHPGNELRNQLRFGAEEAKIAVEVLNIVHRDLAE